MLIAETPAQDSPTTLSASGTMLGGSSQINEGGGRQLPQEKYVVNCARTMLLVCSMY